MKRIIAILLLLSMLFSCFNIAYALIDNYKHEGDPIADIDYLAVDWSMTEEELISELEKCEYTRWTRQSGGSVYSFYAYFAGYKSEINLVFDESQHLDKIWLYPESPYLFWDHSTICISLLSSKLGMPIYCEMSDMEVSSYGSLYTWQTAIWPVHNETVYVYSCDNEIYYSIDEETLEIEIDPCIGYGCIELFPSYDYEWAIEYYNVNK